MQTTISNHKPPQLSPSGSSPTSTPAATTGDAAGSAATSSVDRSDDQVRLTGSAQALTAAARSGDGSPVSAAKVGRLRQAIADGSYQVNPSRIADSLINLDQQMGGVA
jgi:negative regulator of flagellin synthesis FlgM